jgi:hypothetical protein
VAGDALDVAGDEFGFPRRNISYISWKCSASLRVPRAVIIVRTSAGVISLISTGWPVSCPMMAAITA